MQKLLKNQKGITLIEIVITLAVLAIVIIPLSDMMVTSIKINSNSKRQLEANNIAQLYMENWKARNLNNLLNDSQIESLNLGNAVQLAPESYNGYTVETRIVPQMDYKSEEVISYSPDVILKLNESTNKLSIYRNMGTKLTDIDLQSAHQIDIVNIMGTNRLTIASEVINTTNSEKPVIQVLVQRPCNVVFNVNNFTDKRADFYIIKSEEADSSVIDIIAQTGKVKSYSSTAKVYGNNLYNVEISVKHSGKNWTTLSGLKMIEFK